FVAVPTEIGLGDRKLRIGKRPEPARVDGNGFAHRANHFLGEVFMLRQRDAAHLHWPSLAEKLSIVGAAQECEVAGTARQKIHLLEAVALFRNRRYLSGAADLLSARKRDANAINASLVEPGLVPGDERSWL